MAKTTTATVWGTTSTGRVLRLLNFVPENRWEVAGWEIGVRLDTDGQWVMTWLPDTEIVTIDVVEPTTTHPTELETAAYAMAA